MRHPARDVSTRHAPRRGGSPPPGSPAATSASMYLLGVREAERRAGSASFPPARSTRSHRPTPLPTWRASRGRDRTPPPIAAAARLPSARTPLRRGRTRRPGRAPDTAPPRPQCLLARIAASNSDHVRGQDVRVQAEVLDDSRRDVPHSDVAAQDEEGLAQGIAGPHLIALGPRERRELLTADAPFACHRSAAASMARRLRGFATPLIGVPSTTARPPKVTRRGIEEPRAPGDRLLRCETLRAASTARKGSLHRCAAASGLCRCPGITRK